MRRAKFGGRRGRSRPAASPANTRPTTTSNAPMWNNESSTAGCRVGATRFNSYRSRMGADEPVRMAVIVQLMVPSEVSGVAFTQDPTGRQRDAVVIESCWGLGAALVDGRVTPDCYVAASLVVRTDRTQARQQTIQGRRRSARPGRHPPAAGAAPPAARLHAERCSDSRSRRTRSRVRVRTRRAARRRMGHTRTASLFLLQSRPISTPTREPNRRRGTLDRVQADSGEFHRRPHTTDGRHRPSRAAAASDNSSTAATISISTVCDAGFRSRSSDTELVELALLKSDRSDYHLHWTRLSAIVGFLAIAYVSTGLLWVRSRHLPFVTLADFRKRCDAMLADSKARRRGDVCANSCSARNRSQRHRSFRSR